MAATHASGDFSTKDVYFTMTQNGQTILVKTAIDPKTFSGSDVIGTGAAAETIATVGNGLSAVTDVIEKVINFLINDWKLAVLGALALIILIKRL